MFSKHNRATLLLSAVFKHVSEYSMSCDRVHTKQIYQKMSINICFIDRPKKPKLSNDSHPFVGFPTVFTCRSRVQRWPERISSRIDYNFSGNGEQQKNTLRINITHGHKNTTLFCQATDDLGKSSNHSNVITIDPYYGPNRASIEPDEKHINVTEGETLGPIHCHGDCYPNCTYEWQQEGRIFSFTNILKIINIDKKDSGKYQCKICHPNNPIIDQCSTVDVIVTVYYPPSFGILKYSVDNSSFQTDTTIVFDESQHVDLEMNITSDPVPRLSFSSSNFQSTLLKYTNPTNKAVYTTRLPALKCENSNTYTITADNNIGKSANMTLQLIIQCSPKDIQVIPDNIGTQIGSVENISVAVTAYPKPSVNWIRPHLHDWSSYDTVYKYKYRFSSVVRITDEEQFGKYGLKICNKLSCRNLTITISPKAAPELTTSAGKDRNFIIGAVSGVLALIILTCAGVVAILLKRRRNYTTEKNVSYVKDVHQSEQRLTQENSFERENTEYAVVVKQKSNNESQIAKDNPQNSEYAAVVKPKSKKTSSKAKFENTDYAVDEKANQHNDVTEETEYANEGDQQLHLQNIGRKQNKDGLIYLEVTFTNNTSNSRPVVRDPYQKTDYVDIDFTRKAEMLPEDSD